MRVAPACLPLACLCVESLVSYSRAGFMQEPSPAYVKRAFSQYPAAYFQEAQSNGGFHLLKFGQNRGTG